MPAAPASPDRSADDAAPPRSARADTILDAAEHLVLKQGFRGVSMATVARTAHVGKGTAYQYWRTKEELFLELFSRHLSQLLEDLAARVRADPDLARPERLCPEVVHAERDHPLVWALQTADAEVLGALLDDGRILTLMARHGPDALLRALTPLWQEQGAARTDWSAEELAEALSLPMIGYVTTVLRASGLGGGLQLPDPGAATPDIREQAIRRVLDVVVAAPGSRPESAPSPGNGDGDRDGDGAPALAAEVARLLEAHAARVLAAGRDPESLTP